MCVLKTERRRVTFHCLVTCWGTFVGTFPNNHWHKQPFTLKLSTLNILSPASLSRLCVKISGPQMWRRVVTRLPCFWTICTRLYEGSSVDARVWNMANRHHHHINSFLSFFPASSRVGGSSRISCWKSSWKVLKTNSPFPFYRRHHSSLS